jgi:hypothetical protein
MANIKIEKIERPVPYDQLPVATAIELAEAGIEFPCDGDKKIAVLTAKIKI